MLDGDLIDQEAGRACAGEGDRRPTGRQFRLEFAMQELCQTLFDLLSFGIGSGEPEQVVICLCRGPDYADPGGGWPASGWLAVCGAA